MSGEPPNGETHLEPMAENVTESPPVEIITTDQIIETSTIESATPVGVAETNNGATNDFGGGASGRPSIYLRHRCMRLVRTDRIDCDGEAHAILYPDLYTTRLAEAVECVTCKSRVTTRQILTHAPHRDFLPKNLSRSELVKKCSEFGNDEAMRCRRNGRWRTCLVLHSNMPSSAEREAYEYVKNLFFREVQNKADARKGILPGADKRKGKKRKLSGDHVVDDNEMNFFLEGSLVVENEEQTAVPEILHSSVTTLISQLRHISSEMKARDAQIQSLLKRNAELEQEVDSLKKRGNQQVTRTDEIDTEGEKVRELTAQLDEVTAAKRKIEEEMIKLKHSLMTIIN